jgi:predicted short-subunit dehydrogenase-like oxidoreductase (DUF2520 family)
MGQAFGCSCSERAEAAAFIGGEAQAATYAEIQQHAARILIAVPDDAVADVARELAGVRVAWNTLRPMQTLANPAEGVRVLPGVAFSIDGAPEAGAWAEHLVSVLGGTPLQIPSARLPRMVTSNYPMLLIATAVMLMRDAGVEEAIARRALEPLARTSVENAFRPGRAAARRAPWLATLEMARQRGLAEEQAGAIEELLRKGERCD